MYLFRTTHTLSSSCICSQNEFSPDQLRNGECPKCKFTLPNNVKLLHQNEDLFSPPTYFAGIQRNSEVTQSLKNELRILKETPSHQHVLRYFAAFMDKSNKNFAIIATELCDGNLQNYIDNKKIHPLTSLVPGKPITECKFARSYYAISDDFDLLYQIVKGLKHLHENNIIHCEIKPDKILLLRKNGKTVAKIGGFKHSKHQSKLNENRLSVTDEYKKTEYWNGDKTISKASDVYALGVLMYNTFTKGKYPFKQNDVNSRKLDFEDLRARQSECKAREKQEKVKRKEERKKEKTEKEVKRQENLNGADNLKHEINAAVAIDTEEKWITTIDMIKRMLNAELTIMDVFHHPTFYNYQKKIDFLLKLNRSLQKKTLEYDIIKKVNKYSLSLLDDQKNIEDKEEFNIDYKNLFDREDKFYYFLEGYPKSKPTFKPLKGVFNVKTLLNGLRNKVTHANDSDEDLPIEFRNDFQVSKDSYNSTLFFKVFLADTPQLLVHLYELFRNDNENRALEFYTDVE